MSTAPSRRRTVAVVTWSFVAWTFLIWTFRIGTIWDGDGATAAKVGRTLLALSFSALACATVWSLVRRPRARRTVVGVFAAWTIAVWVVRAPMIVFADHGTAFVLVHLALAAVSAGLAIGAVREARATEIGAVDVRR